MPRIRSIKPELFTDENLSDLEDAWGDCEILLIYIGLWTQADFEGRFEFSHKQLKIAIRPYSSVNFLDALNLLVDRGFVVKYEVDGKTYGWLPKFRKHQVRDARREPPSKRPPAPGDSDTHPDITSGKVTPEYKKRDGDAPEMLSGMGAGLPPPMGAVAGVGKEGKGKERNGTEYRKGKEGNGREGKPRAGGSAPARDPSPVDPPRAQISSFDLSELLDRAGRVSKDGLQKMIEEAKGNPALSEKLFGIYNERFGPQRTETYDTMRKVGGLTR